MMAFDFPTFDSFINLCVCEIFARKSYTIHGVFLSYISHQWGYLSPSIWVSFWTFIDIRSNVHLLRPPPLFLLWQPILCHLVDDIFWMFSRHFFDILRHFVTFFDIAVTFPVGRSIITALLVRSVQNISQGFFNIILLMFQCSGSIKYHRTQLLAIFHTRRNIFPLQFHCSSSNQSWHFSQDMNMFNPAINSILVKRTTPSES